MIPDGIIVVNKPGGITSHDVVDFVRRKLKTAKVGHAGTLDPIATGVLVLLIGKCTRLFDHFLTFDKEYLSTLTLGKRTDSADYKGKVLEEKEFQHVNREAVEKVFASYLGEKDQVPPMFSAVKHKGKRLYVLARQGKEVERKPRKVNIKELKIVEYKLPHIQFYLRCSRGTYVRQLAEDVAKDLGSVGHLTQIERLSVGEFNIKNALSLDNVDESGIQPYIC